jgi:hypothetical protein
MTNQNNTTGSKFMVFLVGAIIAFVLFTFESRERVGAKCWDGTNSYATGRGACSHHGGVKYWKYDYWWDR